MQESLLNMTLSHYRILSTIGAGGMGEVYLAEDMRLKRRVALKLLPPQFTSDADRRRRFEQEAQAASALNHPNIITIYEIGQVDATHYIAMEFIDGLTLRQRLTGERLPLAAALEIAIQTASALSAAHEAGIIHRDLKPENVMLRRDSYVKVLDFGLAKLTERQAPTADTEAPTVARPETDPGTVMGTARYMSPEQARGLKIDARTDIFSLGVVMYEMLTNRAPFPGATTSDVIASLLKTEPAPLTQHAPAAPAELERIVTKALRKDREERYQTAKDLALDLKSLKLRLEIEAELERSKQPDLSGGGAVAKGNAQAAAGTAKAATPPLGEGATPTSASAESFISRLKRRPRSVVAALAILMAAGAAIAYFTGGGKAIDSVAVLPFVNASADPNMEYLSDGITESIIYSLSQLPKLRVMSRNSVFRYKEREIDAQAAARSLSVRAVVTGRVVLRGESFAMSAELIDARDNSLLWGGQYHGTLADVLPVQEEIAKQLSEKLRLRLSGEERQRLTKRYTESTEAYQSYLKGRYFWNKRTEGGLKKGIEYFDQAIEKDPAYALAYTGLADSYAGLVFPAGAVSPREAMPKAKDAAAKALQIDDTLAEAHTSLAFVKFYYDWDWSGAEREFKRAIELNPAYPEAHHIYSHYLMAMGRGEESLAESKRALELAPLDLVINVHLGWHYLYARQYDQAIEQIEKTAEMERNSALTHYWLGLAYEQKARYADAIAAFQRAIALFGGSSLTEAELAHTYAVSGQRAEAQKVIDKLQELAQRRYVSSYQIAATYAGLGEKDRAFAWLEKAYDERSDWLVNLKVEQRFDGLRSDPRFADLLRRVNLAL
jgi:eukaryotic-like serine/threonine-protein kinase